MTIMKSGGSTNGTSGSGWKSGRPGEDPGDVAVLRWFDRSVCVFWLGNHCYGIVASLVGEVFVVDSCAPVPIAPPAVIGVFNLRGTPVALVDLSHVLELPGAAPATEERSAGNIMALVLRTGAIQVAAQIRKMEVVVPAGRALYSPPDESAGEHPVVAGFLELPSRPDLTITLLDPEVLVSRLDQLRYRNIDEEDKA